MKAKSLIMWCVLLILLFVGNTPVDASEFNFSVEPILPKNQHDQSVSYFDLLLKPNEKQDVSVKLTNSTDREIKVAVDASPTTTNMNGVVEYSPNDIKPDPTLQHNLKDLVIVDHEVTLPAHSQKDLTVSISMPNEEMPGIVAGGLTFEEIKEDSKKEKKTSKGMSIKNRFSYVIGMILQTKSSSDITPDLRLNNAKATQVNARNSIQTNLQNPMPVYLSKLAIKATVTKKGKDEVLYSHNASNMQMAPNSNFDFQIPLEGEPMKAGNYTVHILAHGIEDENGSYTHPGNKDMLYKNEWTYKKDFTITRKEAKEFNEKDVSIEKDDRLLYMMAAIIFLLIAILIIILVKSKKKNEK